MLLLLRMQKMGMPHGIGCEIQISFVGVWPNSIHDMSRWWLWLLVGVLIVQHDGNGRARQVCRRKVQWWLQIADCRLLVQERRRKELDPRSNEQTNSDSQM